MKDNLEKILQRENLTLVEAYNTMNMIMSGEVNNSLLSALLIALKMKGYHPDEIAGFAKAMRDNSLKIKNDIDAIDLCGTGGDSSGTFNISTTSAFITAGAGVAVAKHGNRAVSSSCGSADLLDSLGVNINLEPERAENILNEIGISFLFAPIYHPAMKHAAQVRKELGMKTIFNLLGPLTNPANVKKQLIGTYSNEAASLLSQASSNLDYEKVCFICTDDRFDEFIPNEKCVVYEDGKNFISTYYELTAESLNLPIVNIENLKVKSSNENRDMSLSILKKKDKTEAYYTAIANAALAIYVAGKSDDLIECKHLAEESVLSGNAFNKLNSLITLSNKS